MDAVAPIYLDHAAATPLDPEVAAVIAEAQAGGWANPSSQHGLGRVARRMLEDARERIMAVLGARVSGPGRDRLVFVSGASEANRAGIVGMAAASARTGEMLWSRRDHPSSVAAAAEVAGLGWQHRELGLDPKTGTVASAATSDLVASAGSGPRIVSCTLVCGQTGSIEAIPAAGSIPPGIAVHVDATQAAGLVPIVFHDMGVATLAFAPHKCGGPRGIGGLLIRGDVAIAAVQAGTQEHGLRGGTEAVALAAGFARAVELAAASRAAMALEVAALRDRFEERLVAMARAAGVSAAVIAAAGRRCPHISTIAFSGIDRQMLAMAADLAGVCLATGTACASGSSEPAPALVAMGLAGELVRGAVRFSFGRTTTPDDVEQAVERLGPLLRRLQGAAAERGA